MRFSLITGTCLTLSLIGAFLLLPRHRPLAAQEVRQALNGARSWHLTGWKMDGDKRLAWEVWGQRVPFFYRERVGDQETLDNGQYRYLALPPVMPGQAGVVLKTPSRMNSKALDQNFPALTRLTNMGDVWKRAGRDTTYSVSESWVMSLRPLRRNDLYTFAPNSPLPKQYSQNLQQYGKRSRSEAFDERSIQKGPVEKEWEDAHLEAEYNLTIPPEAARIEAKPGYRLLDATQNTLPPGVEAENAVVNGGITLKAEPAMVDAQGNIALVLRSWIGSVSLGERRNEEALPLGFSLYTPEIAGINSVGDVEPEEQRRASEVAENGGVLYLDDRGRAYLPVKTINWLYSGWQPALMVLTPLEPLKSGEPLPRQITIRLFGGVYQPENWRRKSIDKRGAADGTADADSQPSHAPASVR